MAKAIQVTAFKGNDYMDALKLADIPIPEPKAGEVLIQPYLRPVNPTDILLLTGGWGGAERFPLPHIPGSEGVARVLKNGPGASKFKEGQRVVAVQWPQFVANVGGSWTTHVAVPEDTLVAVPDGVTDESAAQFFINPVTVYGMLHECAVPKGEWLLQTAANSTLGLQMIQLAKHYGIKTINVVRRKEAAQALLDAGGDAVIHTDTEDLEARVKEITGGAGAYAAIDAVGGPQAEKVVASLRKYGKYLVYGALDPQKIPIGLMDLLAFNKVVSGFLIYNWVERPDKAKVLDEVMKLIADGTIKLGSGKSYPLEQYKEAIKEGVAAGRGAKVFLSN